MGIWGIGSDDTSTKTGLVLGVFHLSMGFYGKLSFLSFLPSLLWTSMESYLFLSSFISMGFYGKVILSSFTSMGF